MMYRYRDRDTNYSTDSDDENSSSPLKMNKNRSNSPASATVMDFDLKPEAPTINKSTTRKVNNIWASVVQEQTINDDLCKIGMNNLGRRLGWDRGCESYDFTGKAQDTRSDPETDEEIDLDYGVSDIENEFEASEKNLPSIERSKKKTTEKISFKESLEDAQKVGRKLAYELNEPKVELLERCVQALGKKKVFDLFHMTEDIEESGGMLIANGSRKRTPGGVFFYQLRKDNTIGKKEKDYIFAEDRAKYMEVKKAQKKLKMKKLGKKRNTKQVKMDMEKIKPTTTQGVTENAEVRISENDTESMQENVTGSMSTEGTSTEVGLTSDTTINNVVQDEPQTNCSDVLSDVELEEGEIV